MADKRLNLIVDLINKTEAGFKKVYSDLEATEKRTENMTRAMKEIGLVGGAAFAGLSLVTKKFLGDAAQLEQAGIAFETMLGSGEKAQKMLEDLSDFAAKTPFELQGIRGTAKQLLAMSIPAEDLIPTMKALGDVSAGLGVDLDRLAYNYGQVKTQTKLTGVEMKDFMRAGVPLLGVLADMLGKTEGEIQEMVSAGQIGFPLVEEAFRRMTSEGGQFNDLMFKQSASLTGQLSNLQDNITRLSEKIGTALLPIAKEVTDWLIKVTEKISAWAQENPELAATILKVALAVTALMATMGIMGVVLPRIITTISLMSKAWVALRGVMLTQITITGTLTKAKNMFTAATGLATTSVRAFIASLLTLRGAIMATGIGALIVLIGYTIGKFMELTEVVGGFGNAFKYIWLQVKKIFYDVMLSIVEGLDKLFSKIPGMKDVISDELIEGFKILSEETDTKMTDIVASVHSVGTEALDTAAVFTEAGMSMQEMMDAIGTGAEDQKKAMEDYLKSLVDAVSGIRDEIKDIYDEINEATLDFQKSVGDENQSYEGKVVDIVAGATEEKKSLEKQLREARKEGNAEAVADLKEKIKEQEEILESYKDLNLDLDKEIRDRRRYLNMNELEQLEEDHKKKLEMMKEEFLSEQVERLKRLVALQTEHAQVMALQSLEMQAKIEAEIAKTRTVREQLALQKQGIQTWTQEATYLYSKFVNDTNSILSRLKMPSGSLSIGGTSIAGRRAKGGPVAANRTYLVGENGPELFTPEQSGRISANGAGGPTISIVFSNNHFTNEDFAKEIEKTLEQRLKRQMRFSLP